ncbi:MAG: leucine-rich repeat domain-containing protein, partial [Kiritimatiellaeota bacterium]|nr:leucine-rich repeat domain-containing protein [Kiritimatiellota bacterium]
MTRTSRLAAALSILTLAASAVRADRWNYDAGANRLTNNTWRLSVTSSGIVAGKAQLTVTGSAHPNPIPGVLDFTEELDASSADFEIVAIGSNAFSGIGGLVRGLVLPDTLQSIGNTAFQGAFNIVGDVVIPPSVTLIGERAFTGAGGATLVMGGGAALAVQNGAFQSSNFTGLVLLPGVATIGVDAFSNCPDMRGDLEIPESVTSIGNNAFYQNNMDGVITLGGGSSLTIGENAFHTSKFTGLIIREGGATTIGNGAFGGAKLTGDIIIPNGVLSIGNSAFNGCRDLNGNLVIGNSCASIGNNAFWDCGFEGFLVVGEGVQEVKSGVFNS